MCEIKPKHTDRFVIEVFTSHPDMTRQQFDEMAAEALVRKEIELNTGGQLRFHVHHLDREYIKEHQL